MKLELPYVGILRFEDGKIVDTWVECDNMSALTQLGHLSPPQK
jgi:predicted ester cyclase